MGLPAQQAMRRWDDDCLKHPVAPGQRTSGDPCLVTLQEGCAGVNRRSARFAGHSLGCDSGPTGPAPRVT